jgi:ABC-2 type transport system permease protein
VAKEMADHLSSVRMQILELLIVLTAAGTVYVAMNNIRATLGEDPFILLKLFTIGQDPVPAFAALLAFLVPLIAIALAFDAVNGEFNRRTISRILAQPIYRDALLLGKFLAALFTLALVLMAIWLLIIGLGIFGLGIPPSISEVMRSLWFWLASVLYGGVWLALALVFSVRFRQPATAALGALSVWLFFTIFWDMIVGVLTPVLSPVNYGTLEELVRQAQMQMMISRLSPNVLYGEAMIALLQPTIRSVGIVLTSQLQGAVMGAPLPLTQSLLLIWPHLTALAAGTILLFAAAYVLFQRQEIRA